MAGIRVPTGAIGTMSNGSRAPTAKVAAEVSAAWTERAVVIARDAQLVAGMGTKRILRHQLNRHLLRERGVETMGNIDVGQLLLLKTGTGPKGRCFAGEIGGLGVGLRAYGDILAHGHRHGASDQARDARHQDVAARSTGRRHANDQAGGRDDAIIGAEHGRTEPTNPGHQVVLRMGAQTTHGTCPSGSLAGVAESSGCAAPPLQSACLQMTASGFVFIPSSPA